MLKFFRRSPLPHVGSVDATWAIGAIGVLVLASCSSSPDTAGSPTPSTVAQASVETDSGVLAVNVGMILNTFAPTAARDTRIADVMSIAAATSPSSVTLNVETVSIGALDEVTAAVRELVDRGVTVIATSCDDSSMPAVVDAALEQELLAVTACVAIPRPDLTVRSRLFIDLAGLRDTPEVITTWAQNQGTESIAILSSGLIPDVDETCLGIETELATSDVALQLTSSFTELIDDPRDLVASVSDRLAGVDLIVICALTPSIGDLVGALRASGFDQPVVVPWFGEPQQWPSDTNNVFIITPASRHGDDPAVPVQELFESLPEPDAVDVVAADTLAILAAAAERAGSAGSRRLADTMRMTEAEAISGTIAVDSQESSPIGRNYRVLEIVDGEPEFLELVSTAD